MEDTIARELVEAAPEIGINEAEELLKEVSAAPLQLQQCEGLCLRKSSREDNCGDDVGGMEDDFDFDSPIGMKVMELATPAAVTSATVDQQYLDQLPSIGSIGHEAGECKRCCFYSKGRCNNGYECRFCHYEHDKTKRAKSKKVKQEVGVKNGLTLTGHHTNYDFTALHHVPEDGELGYQQPAVESQAWAAAAGAGYSLGHAPTLASGSAPPAQPPASALDLLAPAPSGAQTSPRQTTALLSTIPQAPQNNEARQQQYLLEMQKQQWEQHYHQQQWQQHLHRSYPEDQDRYQLGHVPQVPAQDPWGTVPRELGYAPAEDPWATPAATSSIWGPLSSEGTSLGVGTPLLGTSGGSAGAPVSPSAAARQSPPQPLSSWPPASPLGSLPATGAAAALEGNSMGSGSAAEALQMLRTPPLQLSPTAGATATLDLQAALDVLIPGPPAGPPPPPTQQVPPAPLPPTPTALGKPGSPRSSILALCGAHHAIVNVIPDEGPTFSREDLLNYWRCSGRGKKPSALKTFGAYAQ